MARRRELIGPKKEVGELYNSLVGRYGDDLRVIEPKHEISEGTYKMVVETKEDSSYTARGGVALW